MIIQNQIMIKQIKCTYNTKVLKSNLCDNIDAYILVRGEITIIGHQAT